MLQTEELCCKILDAHAEIRWVKVIDQDGKIALEMKKPYVEPYLSKEAMESLRMLWIEVIRGIIGRVAQYWGAPQHLHIQLGKVVLFGFPLFSGAVVVVAEPTVPLASISEIQRILRSSIEASCKK